MAPVWEIPSGSQTARDLADLNNDDVTEGSGGTGFAATQSGVESADTLHRDISGNALAAVIYLQLGGIPTTDKNSGGDGSLLVLPPPIPLEASVGAAAVTGKVPGSVVGGASANSSVSVVAQNTCTGELKEDVTVQLYVSPDGSLADATPVGSPVVKKVSLKASKSVRIPVKIKSFPSEPGGTYQLIAAVTDSSGNTSSVAGPSLTIAPPFVTAVLSGLQPRPAGVAPGKKESLVFTVTNSGNIAAAGAPTLAISLSTDSTGANAQAVAGVPVKIKLKAGAHGHYSAKFTVPSDLAAGAYFASVSLDVAALGDAVPADGVGLAVMAFTVK